MSKFDGSVMGNIGTSIVMFFMCFIPIIGAAMGACYKQRWIASHTVIDGRRQRFEGQWSELFVKIIIWGLLTFITIGIYGFVAVVRAQQWYVKNTHAEETPEAIEA